ncbi:glycosyltransferase family 2 protein [Pseudomonas sp. Marseille-QA0892]
MSQSPDSLNVITLVHGRREQLNNVLLGLERSNRAPTAVWIVFMNETPEALKSTHFPIHSLRVDGAAGLPLAKARNQIIHGKPSDRWVFLDIDCIPSSDLLDQYATALDAEPAALHLGEVRYLPKGANENGWTESGLHASAAIHPLAEFRTAAGEPMPHHLFWSLNFACTGATFERIGGFDEGYEGYGAEDTDFAFRARDRGIPLLATNALAYHQYHPTYRPPLNHFDAIVANASRFHAQWNTWPMDGWLQAFADRQLIEWNDDAITVLRRPTSDEVDGCFDEALKGF